MPLLAAGKFGMQAIAPKSHESEVDGRTGLDWDGLFEEARLAQPERGHGISGDLSERDVS